MLDCFSALALPEVFAEFGVDVVTVVVEVVVVRSIDDVDDVTQVSHG